MGLAPFFDRARQSAAQVLRDFDAAAFEGRLGEVVVTIAFDTHAATSVEGLAALDMTARLSARLYPRVRVRALDGDGAHADQLIELMRRINPDIDIVEGPSPDEVVVVAGTTAVNAASVIYVGSDRWIAKVSTLAPVGFADSHIPFGAGAAACIAMANVFRAVFGAWLEKPALDGDVALSLLNFELGDAAANADLGPGFDIGLAQLVGVGAIGNAFVSALSRLRVVEGVLHLIDHETIELTNLQRYVLPVLTDDGASKVALAAAALDGGEIRAVPFVATWADYVAGVGHHRFDTVAVALDSVRDRIQVQSSLPRRIVNSWTQVGDLGVSRHGFGAADACLACLYLPTGARRNEDQIVAEELGFPPDELLQVRAMLYFGTPVSEQLVRQISERLGLDPGALLQFVGLPLRAFRQKAICGNAIIKASDGGGTDLEVPMAFQSALAGVMLAAEVVASATGIRLVDPPVRSSLDLIRALPGRISFPMRKGAPGPARCICEDPDFVNAYAEKYGACLS